MTTQTHNKPVIGVVLAGGLSSRMGKDKALLRINAQPMIERTANTLRNTSVSKVVISRNDGGKGHLADIISGKGPLSGIHSVAMRFTQYNLLILPVDLPLMDANTLQQLIESGEDSHKNTRFMQDNLPLFINNTASFRQVLDYTLTCTDCYSVARLCSHFPINEIEPAFRSKTFNTNTPEQWRFAMQHFNNSHSKSTTEEKHESF